MFDYKALGFMCGLEIHQQLRGKKLFCDCPTIIRKDKPDFKFVRRLRASAGESGIVDKAAVFETSKSKVFEYYGFNDCTCLVELDEEPPHSVNFDALKSAISIAKLLNMKLVDKVQFMRKTVIDGSNVSGFQRTALIGYDGFILVNKKKIRVDTLCLEEEAAQSISRSVEKDEYNISRLGIPLIEIATAPDISSSEECRDVAAHLGMILRSLDNCMRGIGSIRQDVNVSIKGGERVEIKGFQDIRKIPLVVNNEIQRHIDLLGKGKKVEKEVRKAEPDNSTSFLRPMPGADRMYPETDIEIICSKDVLVEIPETIDEKVERYKKMFNLSEDLAIKVVKQESKSDLDFEEVCARFESPSLSPTNIADFFLSQVPSAEKKYGGKVGLVFVDKILNAFSEGKVVYSSVKDVLGDALRNELDLSKYYQLDDKEIKDVILKTLKDNKGAPLGLIMGKVMSSLKGRADGKKVKEFLDKEFSN